MAWYISDNVKCPNCNKNQAKRADRGTEALYLICVNCGLCLFASYKEWIVDSSYIDKNIIGLSLEALEAEEIVIEEKNEDIIKKGTIY